MPLPSKRCGGETGVLLIPALDHALVAHLAELVVLQPEQVAENLLVLRADGLAEPLDFAGGGGEARHDIGDGDGAGA